MDDDYGDWLYEKRKDEKLDRYGDWRRDLRKDEKLDRMLDLLIENKRLRVALLTIEEVLSGTSDEAMKIQKIIDKAIR